MSDYDKIFDYISENYDGVDRDPVEQSEAYKAIPRQELERAILQAFYEQYDGTIPESPMPMQYWYCKKRVLFDQYGIVWTSPQYLNDHSLSDSACEYIPDMWEDFEPTEAPSPLLSERPLEWEKIRMCAEYTTHDFGRSNSTSDESVFTRDELEEGTHIDSRLGDMFYWASATVTEITDEYVAGTSSHGDFKVTPFSSFRSEARGIDGYAVSGSISIGLVTKQMPIIKSGEDPRRLRIKVYASKNFREGTYQLKESLDVSFNDLASGYRFYHAKDINAQDLYDVTCQEKKPMGITGQITLLHGSTRNFNLRVGEYFRYLDGSNIVVVSVVDDEHPVADKLADYELFRPFKMLRATEDEATLTAPTKHKDEEIVTAEDILNAQH